MLTVQIEYFQWISQDRKGVHCDIELLISDCMQPYPLSTFNIVSDRRQGKYAAIGLSQRSVIYITRNITVTCIICDI